MKLANRTRPMGDLETLPIKQVAAEIMDRTGWDGLGDGLIIVFINDGKVYACRSTSHTAKWLEVSKAPEIIGYYNCWSSEADIAEDLADAQVRALGAARMAA